MESNATTPLAAPTARPRRWPALTMTAAFAATLLAGVAGVAFNAMRSPGTPPGARTGDVAATGGTAAGGWLDAVRRSVAATASWDALLAERSLLSTAIRPAVQAWLSTRARQGSAEVVAGRDHWLFFRPAVEHLVAPPFLAPSVLAATGGAVRHRDPRPAILELAGYLKTRGIALVLVPVPVKAALEPEHIAPGVAPDALPLANPSLAPLLRELEQAGMLVFDPAPVLADLKRHTGKPVYLATDTHWRPEAAAAVARALAVFLREKVELDAVPDPGYQVEASEVTGRGDLVGMLGLGETSRAFESEKVTVERVIDSEDRLWRLDTSADVLVLGDSFANIYSLPAMNWGEAGGFIEHLSLAMARPVDAILRNDSGAWATRALLSRELAAGRDRLAGKRVVVWELAARELSVGDWRPVPMALGTASQGGFFVPKRGTSIEVEGVITAMGVVPQPRSAPYADYIVALRLSDLQATSLEVAGHEAVVFVVAMRDYALTPPAAWRVGQRVAVRLRPWADLADEYGFFTRGELADDSLMLVEPCFGEEVGR
jgi:hypothetical protein